jgi:hypothetical protein
MMFCRHTGAVAAAAAAAAAVVCCRHLEEQGFLEVRQLPLMQQQLAVVRGHM